MRDPKPTHALRAALAAAVVAILIAVPGHAGATIMFIGSGYGHGAGLGQYGAFGLAQRGWGPLRIVKHYYTDTTVARRDPPRGQFRVGLLQHRSRVTITVARGVVALRLASGKVIERIGEGTTRTLVVTKSKRYRVKRPNGTVVGDRLWGGVSDPLEVRRQRGAVVRVAEWGHRAGRGFLRLKIAASRSAHLVAVVPPEHYLYGLGEVPASWPMAALKAQVIVGRSFAYRTVQGGRDGCACDIFASVRDQAYIGWDMEGGPSGDRWVRAVDGTSRQVAVHGGAVIEPLYSSSSGGYTEDVENIWGGSPVPYLKGVCDPGDWTSANPSRTWSVGYGAAELATRLGRPNGMVRVTRVDVPERGVSGRVVRATVRGKRSDGSATSWSTSGWNLRSRLGLRDTRFWVDQNRNVTGKIRTRYDALGCRPGLATSAQRKIDGGRWQNFERGRMYHHGGRGRVTWVRGAALRKYVALRAHRGFLGRPWAYRSEAGGVRARFDAGDIYASGGVGAHEVHGRVLPAYRNHGGPGGDLGFPTSDVVTGGDGTLSSTFEHGSISCRPGQACRVTRS